MFTEEQIKEFQKIYEEEFGERISKAEAIHQGIKLMNLLKTILRK